MFKLFEYIYIYIQSSVVITQPISAIYYINDYRKCGRISIRCWISQRHPIDRPLRPMLIVNVFEKK